MTADQMRALLAPKRSGKGAAPDGSAGSAIAPTGAASDGSAIAPTGAASDGSAIAPEGAAPDGSASAKRAQHKAQPMHQNSDGSNEFSDDAAL